MHRLSINISIMLYFYEEFLHILMSVYFITLLFYRHYEESTLYTVVASPAAAEHRFVHFIMKINW